MSGTKFVAALGSLSSCVLLLLFFPSPTDTHPSESIRREVEIKPAQVRVDATLDSNRVQNESPDDLQITLWNDSDRILSSTHLSINAPGFTLDQTNVPCLGIAGKSTAHELAAHQSCQFVVHLSPAARSGTYGIAAAVDWWQPDAPGQASLLLGPVTIDRVWGSAKWALAARRLGSLLKDLTLPLIIVGLGAFFAKRQSEREAGRQQIAYDQEKARIQREKDAEETRLRADKDAEQRRLDAEKDREEKSRAAHIEQMERHEVHRLLLARVMELAEQHYLLFVNHARLVLIECDKIRRNKPDAAPDKLFLQILFLIKRMEMFRLTRVVFFQTRECPSPVFEVFPAAW